ncbi:unnamed protein product [Thelazia callipaeda]|uniref:EB domain-containing protein n=1 Tax=Thelazia callipaeda TaxID=103827 RepID=A0A0N5D3C5_THECL|nr:unnamed protein product [Thelazia callipaeda]
MQIPLIISILFFLSFECCWAYSQCLPGGYAVALGCNTAQQCTPYTAEPVACIDGACCVENNAIASNSANSLSCTNGGKVLAAGCVRPEQCLPFTSEPVACMQGLCCTVPQKCPNGGRVVGLQCSDSQSCIPLAKGCPVVCMNELCCTIWGY